MSERAGEGDSADVDRLVREQDFHDARYTEETREATRKFYSVDATSQQAYLAAIAAAAGSGRAIEYGCGLNSPGFDLAATGVPVLGIDISPVAIEQSRAEAAERGLTNLEFEVMNAEHLDLADQSAELAFGTGILHHLDLDAAVPELARVLAPSGRAVFFEPLGHNPVVNLYRRATPRMRTPDEHPLRTTDLELFQRWFATVDLTFYNLVSLAVVPLRSTRAFPGALRFLESVDASLFARVPASRWWAWTVLVELGDPTP